MELILIRRGYFYAINTRTLYTECPRIAVSTVVYWRINSSRKVLHHFAIRAIINEIIGDERSANPRIDQARGEKRPSSKA